MAFFIPFLIGIAATYATTKVVDKVVDSVGPEKKVTNADNQQQKILESTNQKLENLDKDIAEKVKEQIEAKLGQGSLTPREKKERLEEIKKMSKEEKAELLQQLKNENSAEQEVINKALKDKLDKQEKRNIQLAEELRQAKESNDPAQIAKITAMMKDNDKNQQATRLALKKNEEEAKKQAKLIEQYFQAVEQDKPWYLDMNFKSPWLWGILLFSCVLFYLMFKGFMWSWNKIKSAIWGDSS